MSVETTHTLSSQGGGVRTTFLFDLELKHSNEGSCERESGSTERCSVRLERLLEGRTTTMSVIWGSTSCSRDTGEFRAERDRVTL